MKQINGFTNCLILTEKGLEKTSLEVKNDIIGSIGAFNNGLTFSDEYMILPGFIDQHIHGAAGSDAMDGTIEDLSKIACAIASEGTVAFLATTMTQSEENINNALSNVSKYMESNPSSGARVLGVHLEGPFISPKHVGAQPIEYVVKPNVETFKAYQAMSGNHIKEVTLAVEEEGGKELVKYLHETHVLASMGHTDALQKDVEEAIKLGASNMTHTYNAMKPLHHREIGTVGSALLYDQVDCELICDGIHVSIPAIRLLVKCKPANKLTLITDAMRAKHMADGKWELGGQDVFVANGQARLADGTLAGSVLKMNNAVKNIMNFAGVSLEQAVKYASLNPATNLGIEESYGSIKEGKKANFVVVDKDFNVIMTIRDGKIIYEKGKSC